MSATCLDFSFRIQSSHPVPLTFACTFASKFVCFHLDLLARVRTDISAFDLRSVFAASGHFFLSRCPWICRIDSGTVHPKPSRELSKWPKQGLNLSASLNVFSSSDPAACKRKTVKCVVIVSSGKRRRLLCTPPVCATLTAQEIIVQRVGDDRECGKMCQSGDVLQDLCSPWSI